MKNAEETTRWTRDDARVRKGVMENEARGTTEPESIPEPGGTILGVLAVGGFAACASFLAPVLCVVRLPRPLQLSAPPVRSPPLWRGRSGRLSFWFIPFSTAGACAPALHFYLARSFSSRAKETVSRWLAAISPRSLSAASKEQHLSTGRVASVAPDSVRGWFSARAGGRTQFLSALGVVEWRQRVVCCAAAASSERRAD